MPSASAAGAGSLVRTFSTTTTGWIPSATGQIDTAGLYKWVTVHFSSVGSTARVEFMSSNTDSAYQLNPLTRTWGGTGTYSMGTSVDTATANGVAGIWQGPVIGRYFRLNYVSGAGTVAGTIVLSQNGTTHELGSATGGTGKVTPGTSSTTVLANTNCRSLTLKASRNNAGIIYVGVGSAATAASGLELHAGEAVSLDIGFTGNVYVLGTNATDYLTYLWVN